MQNITDVAVYSWDISYADALYMTVKSNQLCFSCLLVIFVLLAVVVNT